jgi:hypothetical protein
MPVLRPQLRLPERDRAALVRERSLQRQHQREAVERTRSLERKRGFGIEL